MYCQDSTGIFHGLSENTSKFTKIKHDNFEHFLDIMWPVWFDNKSKPFYLIDLNSGRGIYPNGLRAMCFRFIERYLASGFDPKLLTGMLFDESQRTLDKLQYNLFNLNLHNNFIYGRDNRRIMQTVGSLSKGLILHDPNGLANFNMVNTILELYPNMDLFIHLQPANEIRKFWEKNFIPLPRFIKRLNRDRIYISNVYSRYMDCIASSRRIKFRDNKLFSLNTSLTGREILGKIAYKWISDNRLSTEKFIKFAKIVHRDKYTYDNVDYINTRTKVKITCKIHGDFEQNPCSHLTGIGCPKCANARRSFGQKSSLEDFINRAKLVHNNKYTYENVNYINNRTKVKITCKEHGDFNQTPNSHLRGCGCPECKRESTSLLHKRPGFSTKLSTTQSFINKAKQIHGETYTYDDVDYINSYTKVKITCKKHGNFEQTPNYHLNGHGCPKCANELNIRRTLTKQEFIERSNSVHGARYTYDNVDYINTRTKVKITCKIHGDFEQTPFIHFQGAGCPKCAEIDRGKKRVLTTEEFIDRAKQLHDNQCSYENTKYINAKTKVKITCKIHGEFEQFPSVHLHSGCPKCGHVNGGLKNCMTTDEFINRANEVHHNVYTYDHVNYTGTNNKVKITCKLHGDFEQTPSSHLNGKGCPTCGKIKSWETRRKNLKSKE